MRVQVALATCLLLLTRQVQSAPIEASFTGVAKSVAYFRALRQSGVFDFSSQLGTEQRLRLGLEVTHGVLTVEAASELSLFLEEDITTAFPVPRSHPVSAWDTEAVWIDSQNVNLLHRLDRLNIAGKFGNWDVVVGKQVIATGVGKIFQAVSQVPRRAFVIVDPEFPLTEDAITVRWRGPVQWEARFLPKTNTQQGHNFHLRGKSNMDGLDVAMTAGRSDDKTYIGFEAAGALGDALVRAELVGYHGTNREWAQGLIGIDQAHSAHWSTQIELFYNGFGKENGYTWTDTLHRSTPYRGLWYLGATVSWQAKHNWKINVIPIFNLADASTLVHAFVNYSVSQNSELILGQFVGVSLKTGSEFGSKYRLSASLPATTQLGAPDLTYLLFKWYF